jgi:hypothetical protein
MTPPGRAYRGVDMQLNSIFLNLQHPVDVNCQRHGPAALPPEQEPPALIGYEAEWTPEPVWR